MQGCPIMPSAPARLGPIDKYDPGEAILGLVLAMSLYNHVVFSDSGAAESARKAIREPARDSDEGRLYGLARDLWRGLEPLIAGPPQRPPGAGARRRGGPGERCQQGGAQRGMRRG